MKKLPTPVSLALSRRGFAAIAFGALVLVACQNAGFGTNPSALSALTKNVLRGSTVPTPSYSWQPYNSPSSYGNNVLLTGISNNKNSLRIVGVGYTGSTYKSFSARMPTATGTDPTPSPGPPTPDPPTPRPPNVYISEVNDTQNDPYVYSVGYVPPGGSQNCNSAAVVTCGFIYDSRAGQDSELNDPNEGQGQCAKTYLFGTMDANVQVGYYTTGPASGPCVPQAFEEYKVPGGPKFVDISLPASVFGSVYGSKAYGINNKGYVVGTYTTSKNGPDIGWELKDFSWSVLQYNSTGGTAAITEPRDISWDGHIVGWFQQTSSSNINGFLNYHGNWYQENYKNKPSNQTEVFGSDDPNLLVGAYLGSDTYWHGFVAACSPNCHTGGSSERRVHP